MKKIATLLLLIATPLLIAAALPLASGFNIDNSTLTLASGTNNIQVMNGNLLIEPVKANGTGWSNTGIGTSEVNLVSVALPVLAANDQIHIWVLWTKGGTLTNSETFAVRLNNAACTPQSGCSTGTLIYSLTSSSSASTTVMSDFLVANKNATNSQVFWPTGSSTTLGSTSTVLGTASIQTNATPFINIDCTTGTTSADTCTLDAYHIEIIKGQ